MSPGILVAVTIIIPGQHLYLPFSPVQLMLLVPFGTIFSSLEEVFKKKNLAMLRCVLSGHLGGDHCQVGVFKTLLFITRKSIRMHICSCSIARA